MNPQELFLADGKTAGVWFCQKCKAIHGQRVLADQCCDRKCHTCGEPCKPYYTVCSSCLAKSIALQEQERFKKAQKVPEHEWAGGVFYGDTYYSSVADFRDYHADEDVAHVHYLWAADPEKFAHIDADRVLERIGEDGYDGFDTNDLNGVDELKRAIDAFNEANKEILAYHENTNVAVVLDNGKGE